MMNTGDASLALRQDGLAARAAMPRKRPLTHQLVIPTPAGSSNCDLTSETDQPKLGDLLLALVDPKDTVVAVTIVHPAERWEKIGPSLWQPLPYRAPEHLRLFGVLTHPYDREPENLVLSRAQLARITRRLVTSPTWGPAFARGGSGVIRAIKQLQPKSPERTRLINRVSRWSYEARERWSVPLLRVIASETCLRTRGLTAGEAHRLAKQISHPTPEDPRHPRKPLPKLPPGCVRPLDLGYTRGV